MVVDIPAVIKDLKMLRKGLGVQDLKISTKAGSALRRVCGVTANDSPGVVGKKVYTQLQHVLDQLPAAQRDLGRAVLGYDGTAEEHYTRRLEALGKNSDRDIRTVQRRADDILVRVAELMCVNDVPDPHGDPWHTSSLRVVLLVDRPEIEVLETRRVVSHRSDLSEIEHSMTVIPVDGLNGPLDLAAFGIDILSGGDVRSVRKVATNRIAFQLRPPRALGVHDVHEFLLRVRLPRISPFYVCTPAHPCERFELRVRFGAVRPARVWRIDGEFATEAADPLPPRVVLTPDVTGEVCTMFEHLEPARSYGIGWQPVPGSGSGGPR